MKSNCPLLLFRFHPILSFFLSSYNISFTFLRLFLLAVADHVECWNTDNPRLCLVTSIHDQQ